MSRTPIPTWFFVLVVVRRGTRFLVVRERKHGGGWYLPAGRVEPGEDFLAAAERETLEESGLAVRITGLLRVEHSPRPTGARVRVVLLAEPLDPEAEPRSTPNAHTEEAAFLALDAIRRLPLRGTELVDLFAAVAAGAPTAPLSMLVPEGAPWRDPRAS